MRVSAIVVFLMANACGSANSLDGSIDEILPLDFVRTELTKQQSTLVVDYLNDSDGLDEITVRLTVDTSDLELRDGSRVEGASFASAVRLQRATRDNAQFPNVDDGSVRFDQYDFRAGGHVAGEFDIAFEDGRLLLGVFDGTVEE